MELTQSKPGTTQKRTTMAEKNQTGDAVSPGSPGARPTETFINKVEVARRLGKTLRTVDNWMARGLLPYFKIGRSVSFKWSDVEVHLAQTCRVCRPDSKY